MTVEQFKKEFGIIGRSKEINDLCDISMQVAKSDISILIYGESGVGKEVFANAIHKFSNRADKKLVSVNCGAIPEGILESELFGHKKGSFTGAFENRKGYFEIADDGTLFLDEIAEMPLTIQVKLLRVLETKEFIKVGDDHTTKVNVRIIAATNKDLQKEVDAKKFREDLYFRLKAVTLNIPPLRKRKGDIDELVHFFIYNYAKNNNLKEISITDEAVTILRNHYWRGNVRELKNTIESAIALNRTDVLYASAFSSLAESNDAAENRNLPVYLRKSNEEAERDFFYKALWEIKRDLLELKDIMYRLEDHGIVDTQSRTISDEIIPLEKLEKDAIKNALEKVNGNKREAAKLLGISERTFYRKLKEMEGY